MHCILKSSPYADQWRLHHSVEMLGYHKHSSEVRILFALLAENTKDDGPNVLRLLHRGKTHAELKTPWPLPAHPDEIPHDGGAPCLLDELYGTAFSEGGTRLFHRQSITSGDTWKRLPFARDIKDSTNVTLVEDFAAAGDTECPPFTTWTLGPFEEPGLFLIAFTLKFRGTTYERLVETQPFFTVDGPGRLLSRIKYDDVLELPLLEQPAWLDRLRPYELPNHALRSRFYDIIILEPPYADAVEVRREGCSNGIYSAPRQPKSGGRRFVTADPFFTLPLAYVRAAVGGYAHV